ncbi:MAG TPA: hypothetical protein VFG03_04145 [Telluria sp.]|nr:hypothetical protein [Telluria sp.]
MWIVAIAWIYVVGLMAITEPNALAGIMTFFGYCVLPLSLVYYVAGSGRRRARRDAARRPAATPPPAPACACDGGADPSRAESGSD